MGAGFDSEDNKEVGECLVLFFRVFQYYCCFIVYTDCNPLQGNFRTATTTRRAQTTLGSS